MLIPDSLAYKTIQIGGRVDVDAFKDTFYSPFIIVAQDYDGTLTLVSNQRVKTSYYEAYKTPIKKSSQIFVQIKNGRIVAKKLQLIEMSLR